MRTVLSQSMLPISTTRVDWHPIGKRPTPTTVPVQSPTHLPGTCSTSELPSPGPGDLTKAHLNYLNPSPPKSIPNSGSDETPSD